MYKLIRKNSSLNIAILRICSFLLIALFSQNINLKAISQITTSKDFQFDFGRWPYPLYDEVSARIQELSRQYPKIVRAYSIGKSGEGRDLWVIEITNSHTGSGESKPAMWLDATTHGGQVTGRPLLMYFIERILANYGHDPESTSIIDSHTFYIMPMFDVDVGERTLTRHPAWPGYKHNELGGKDLDGDGFITQMRVSNKSGNWYPSSIDPRVMLRVRDLSGGTWNYIPTTLETQEAFEDDLVPRDQRYHIYIEGQSFDRDVRELEGEPADSNRNWPAEWRPEERGAGPTPLSLPEVHAVAKFITSHKNIFFVHMIHSGGGARNYIVRPPMNHPFEFMPPEDNDFYIRMGAIWSALSGGGVINNNYYAQEVKAGRYGETMHGYMNDWAYMHVGIHSFLAEISGAGRDYDGDGYVTVYEIMRWNDKEKGGIYFAPWKPYKHPILGKIEIGGWRGLPQAIGDRLKRECEIHYDLILHIVKLSPLLSIKNLSWKQISEREYRIFATLQNQGFLSTYVTRQALKIKADHPIMAKIQVIGGEVIDDDSIKKVGHILGKLAYIRRWSEGADESTRIVEWMIKATGDGPIEVSVEAWAHKAGRDKKIINIAPKQ